MSQQAAMVLWDSSLQGSADDEAGETDRGLWAAQFGRRIVFTDEQGFIWANRYASTEFAETVIEAINDRYNDATCAECGTHFESADGNCWCCGSRYWNERDDSTREPIAI